MILDPWQILFLETKGDKILASGRQVGKSVVCSIDCSEWAVRNDNQNVLICAPTERQAYGLFTKTLNYLSLNYPKKIVLKGKDRPTQQKINLKNGTTIYCLPVGLSGTGVRFMTIGRLYIDEASRVEDSVYEAIYPALLTTGGDTILLSTFNGTQGEFYNTWINKDGNYDSFTRFVVSSVDVVNDRKITEIWTEKVKQKALMKLEQAKSRLTQRVFAQEYLGIPSEELLNFFPAELIKKCCVLTRREQIQQKRRHIIGVDLARMGDDKSSFQIIDRIDKEHFEHVESITTSKTYMTETFDKIKELATSYNAKQIGIDAGSGSMGVGILDFAMRDEILRNRVVALNNAKRNLDVDGERRTSLQKEDMYQNLKSMMEHGTVKLLDDDEVILSLRCVQFDVKIREGETRNAIFSHTNSDIVEALIRSAWLANEDKSLNLWCEYS